MDQKIKKLWVKALRSGKYRQSKSTLKDQNGYCCLGVLCSVVGKWKDDAETDDENAYRGKEKLSDREEEILDAAFRKRIGLNARSEVKLTLLNDGNPSGRHKALPFSEIADYIEKHY